MPSLLFVEDTYGKAEESIKFYTSVFKDSKMGAIVRYEPGQEPNKEGTVMFADFKLLDTWFAAMDGAGNTISILMKPFHLLFTATIKKKLITTGKNFQPCLNLNSVAG